MNDIYIIPNIIGQKGTRPGRNPTTGKQYFPSSGNQPDTAAKEATGGRIRQAQEKKPGFWNGDVNLYLRV